MNRNLWVGILMVCFGSSSVNAGWATEVMQVAPVVVQPYEIRELTQQVINTDRQNRDEEIAIQKLVEENNQLTQSTLARQEDEGLKKINDTMLSYRKMLYSRDQARIVANSERWPSRYGDLVALTEDADAMTDYRRVLKDKSGLLTEKYQMLNDLKDEMTSLNNSLQGHRTEALNQKDKIIQGYKKIAQEQQDKIQMLVNRLDEMDHKIAHFDEIIEKKDQQIARLKENLVMAQNESAAKDGTIKEQQDQIAILMKKANELDARENHIKSQADQMEDATQEDRGITSSKGKVALPPIYVHTPKQEQDQAADNNMGVIDTFKNQIQQQADELKTRDEMIKAQKNQIDILESKPKGIFSNKRQVNQLSRELTQREEQVELLKEELENKITELKAKNDLIKSQANQLERYLQRVPSQNQSANDNTRAMIETLKNQIQQQSDDLKSKDDLIKSQAEQMERLAKQAPEEGQSTNDNTKAMIETFKNQIQEQSDDLKAKDQLIKAQSEQMERISHSQVSGNIHDKVIALKRVIQQQDSELKAKNDSLKWLNQVLAASKNKTEYFKLTAQHDRLSLQQVKAQVQKIRDDFAVRANDMDQLENTIASLKNQLSQKNDHLRQDAQIEQDLKTQLEDKEKQIDELKAEVQTAAQEQKTQEAEFKNTSAQVDDRMGLAKELIGLQNQEEALLDEKSTLALKQYDIFDRHFSGFESRMKILLASHRIKTADFINHMEELRDMVHQKQQQIEMLNTELRDRISQEKDQSVLANQIEDFKVQLQDKENLISTLKAEIRKAQGTTEDVDALKQQLSEQQNSMDLLKQQLNSKIIESRKMTSMIAEYQKKLETSNLAYNQQLAQVYKLKKDMYTLQALTNAKDRDMQTKDLSISMMQQKMLDQRINEDKVKINGLQAGFGAQVDEIKSLKTQLALAREQLSGMPSSDEISYLKSGLRKATVQLKQKDQMLTQAQANADEYQKEFKAQSKEFQSLKVQLQDAYDDINRRNEDLKYKNLEVIRLKERAALREDELLDQVKALSRKNPAGAKIVKIKTRRNSTQSLQEQLDDANLQIKDLKDQLSQFILPFKKDPLKAKLKQALDKINEQGRIITVLSQKLEAAGQTVNLSRQ